MNDLVCDIINKTKWYNRVNNIHNVKKRIQNKEILLETPNGETITKCLDEELEAFFSEDDTNLKYNIAIDEEKNDKIIVHLHPIVESA